MTAVQPVLTDNVPSMLFFSFVCTVFPLYPVVLGKNKAQSSHPPVSINHQPVMSHQPS